MRLDPSLSAAIASQHRMVCVSLDHARIASPIAFRPRRERLASRAIITLENGHYVNL
ncbi:MAG TPA: hypothetical protein VFI48_03200 [Hyphomicrobiaceae bacterium]|nr:hypothetical protein [Hyphomicrobiaceae bacterium]